MPAGGAVGDGVGHSAVWTAPVLSVARTAMVCEPGLGGLPRKAPQPPGVVGVAGAELGRLPVALLVRTVDADLDGAHPAVLRPRHAAERHRSACDSWPLRGTSMRDSRLDRPARRPAEPRPVRLGAVESGELEVDDPFGGRHVAVQAGHHQPRGVAVLGGQRLAVHPDRQQRVAVVGERLDGCARGEAVDRHRQHHVGVAMNTRFGQQVAHPVARPRRVRDESPPTGLDTHVSVTSFSTTSNRSRSSKR